MKQYFQQYLNYEYWANTKIFDLALQNEHQLKNPEIVYLCLPILDAQNGWYSRVKGIPYGEYDYDNTKHLKDLNNLKEDHYHLWKELTDAAKDEDFNKIYTYTYLEKTSSFMLKDIMTHVINHSTHTRAQIITLLKKEIPTIQFPETDFTAYLRTIKQKPR